MNDYYIYRHRRLDNNQIFYVGLGSSPNYKRAYIKHDRSKWWKNIVAKVDYEVEIVMSNLFKEEACELEEFLILLYGRSDLGEGELVNLTNGGESNSGAIQSEEHKKWRSEKMRGENNHMYGKTGELHHNFGKPRPLEVKNKISQSNIGKICSEETKQKLSNIFKGRKPSEKQIILSRERWLSSNNPNAVQVIHKETKIVFSTIKEGCDYFNYDYEKERKKVQRNFKTSKFERI